MNERTHDIVVYGATGFVGQLVVAHLAKHAPEGTKIALGGRNEAKLKKVAADLSVPHWPIIVADSADAEAVKFLAESTKVVITLVGPYAEYGNLLVDACATAGTHYVDLTGEVLFARGSVARNHELAQSTGAKIIHSCGFDSIPSDVAVRQLYDACGQLGETTMIVKHMRGGASGGTIDSFRKQIAQVKRNPKLKKIIANPYALAGHAPSEEARKDPFQEDLAIVNIDGMWAGPFFMAPYNTRVVQRSAYLQGYGPLFRYREAMRVSSKRKAHIVKAATIAAFTAFSIGPIAKLIDKKLPKPGEGPSKEQRENGRFTINAYTESAGQGYKSTVELEKDPGYDGTAMMISEAALALVHDELPARSGVLTPTVALGDALVERLREGGMKISVKKI